MRSQGAFEAGAEHYPCMVSMHVAFFVSLIAEVFLFDRSLSPLWIIIPGNFSCCPSVDGFGVSLRLGSFGIRKSSFLPGADVVRKGPYHLIRHPNYVIVTTELLVLTTAIRGLFYSYHFLF